jgi:transcriptional regulator with XRE-family HTH domain
MGRVALEPSLEVARLLRDRRRELGWTLREVEERTRKLGRPVHFTMVARVERGEVEPGLRRLHVLFRAYELPVKLLEDLLEIEEFVGAPPVDAPISRLFEVAVTSWKAGDLRQALATLAALKAKTANDATGRYERQKALLTLAVTIGSIGRYRLAKHIVEDLLLEPPEPGLLVPALVEGATCWARLGSDAVALGLLASAEAYAKPEEHRHRALVFHSRASTLTTLRRFEDAEQALAQALVEYELAGDAFGKRQALGVRVRHCFEREDYGAALTAAREARAHAESHGHGRMVVHRMLDEGRVLFELGDHAQGLTTMSAALAQAVASQDPIAQFYGHYYLWKAHRRMGDAKRADLEANTARYFVQFVDATVPEAGEVRALLGEGGERREGRPDVGGKGNRWRPSARVSKSPPRRSARRP